MRQGEALINAAAVIGVSFGADLLAEVAGVDRTDVLDELASCAPVGLLRLDAESGRFFDVAAHRELYDGIRPSERARLHGRVAELLIGWYDDGRRAVHPADVAHHLLASGSDGRRAAEFLLAAGDRAMGEGTYGEAEGHCERALGALRALADADAALARCGIALGTARLARGDLPAAQAAFKDAVGPARRSARGDLLAKAALGLGAGTAGFEIPLVDRAQLDLLEEALSALPDSELSLRARVLARLSVATSLVEEEDRRRSYAAEAVELTRSAGDRTGLCTALAAQCDAFAGPEHTPLRRRLAGEIVTIARETNDREMELLGRRHRLVALAEIGDIEGVDAEIRDFAALSDVVGQPLYDWYVPLWRGMRALMSGRIDECRRRIDEAAASGCSVGSRNAYLLTVTLRWCLLSETADPTGIAALGEELGIDDEPAVWASVAVGLIAAETERTTEARTRLDSLAPRLAHAPRDSEWIPMLTQLAELIGHLGSHPVASWTYEALRPFAGMLVIEGIGAATRGSVHRPLGLLAAALGDTQQAADHFAAAVDVHRAIGAPLLSARAYRDWGIALDDRAALQQALTTYEQLGVAARVEEVRAALGVATPAAGEQRFAREGEMWSLSFHGQTVRLRDSKGLRDLARLLAASSRAVPAVELAAADAPSGRSSRRAASAEQLHQAGDLGEVLDATARAAYRQRLTDLDAEIGEAEEFGDGERAANAKAERDLLVDQLSAAYGLGGRPRRTGDPAERARTAVTARIRDAIRRIEDLHPELGRHLRLSVRTGTLCAYEPEQPTSWTLA